MSEVQQMYPYIQWMDYLNHLLPSMKIDENEIILVKTPAFFEKLGKLLEETPKRTIANYLMWKATESSIDFLTDKLRMRKRAISSTTIAPEETRPNKCLEQTIDK